MLFSRAAIAAVGFVLPPKILTSEMIEEQLEPAYHRLKLPAGRLELMSGIRERRLWAPRTRISDPSIESCKRALAAANVQASDIQCLIHASVCRDFLEPATACRVHHALGLPQAAWVYDVSNACLGIMNAAIQIAQLIEAGIIQAGIAVGTENASGLIETTINELNSDESLTRQTIKPAFASLTIGSGSCAWLIVNRETFQRKGRLFAASARAHTAHNDLCQSDTDRAGEGMQPIMNTDSEKLLEMGIETGAAAYADLQKEVQWSNESIDASVCHQVGSTHRRMMLQRVGLPVERDFATFPFLGNTGSCALPTALGLGLLSNKMQHRQRTVLMGIGSGINSVMLAADLTDTVASGETIEGL